MSSIPQKHFDEKNLIDCVRRFFSKHHVGSLLARCNGMKEKGVSPVSLLRYKLSNIFVGRSMYMQQRTGSFKEDFSKNTFYRFLNSVNDMHFKKGFRILTLSWSDGNTLIPVNSCLLATAKDTNIIGSVKHFDNRILAGKRRKLAQTKAPETMMTLLDTALSAGLKADYVLFDPGFQTLHRSRLSIQKVWT